MTKSIEEQTEEYYKKSGWAPTENAVMNFKAGAKARDEQWLAVVNELRDALKFYKKHADCNSGIIYGNCRCAFCKGDDKYRKSHTKAELMMKEMGIE